VVSLKKLLKIFGQFRYCFSIFGGFFKNRIIFVMRLDLFLQQHGKPLAIPGSPFDNQLRN